MRNFVRAGLRPAFPFLSLSCLALAGCMGQSEPTPSATPADDAGTETPEASDDTNPVDEPGFPVLPSAKAKQIAAGRLHACALTTDGAVRCWGYTEYGQLGNGVVKPSNTIPVPVAVTGLDSGVQAIATYSDTTCAITASGGVKCWGYDGLGELGTGIPYVDSRPKLSGVPVDVQGLTSGVRAISVGSSSSCAITASGGVKCWGQDEYSKLGNGSNHTTGDGSPDFLPPVDVIGLSAGIKEIAVGTSHACALTDEGVLKCWGSNMSGELGLGEGTNNAHAEPTVVTALGSNVAHVNAGHRVTCVIMKDGSAKCFGNGSKGQLGDGKDGIIRDVWSPVDVIGITGMTQIANSGDYTCGIAAGAVKCWGTGPIGSKEGPGFASFVPIQAHDLTTEWMSVATGGDYNCVLSTAGAIKCWGDNGGGMLGDGKGGKNGTEQSETPVNVVSFP